METVILEIAKQVQQGLQDVQATRYAQLASCCIVVFDHLITLDSEVDLVWRSPWSFGKALFIINRYYTLSCVISLLIKVDQPCLEFFRWQGWTGLIACMIAEIILQMRLYALYSLNKKILALMVTSFVAASSVSAVIMGRVLASITATARPLPFIPSLEDFVFCTPFNVSPKFYAFWIPVLLNECLLCILALIRGFQTFRSEGTMFQTGRRLVAILIRDSVLYFMVIMSTYLTCLLVWSTARGTLLEVPIGFSVAMSCVLTNRIILNVRQANKDMNRVSVTACQVTIGEDGSRATLSDAEMAQLRSLRPQRERKFSVL